MRTYETLVDALDDLRKRGYDADFEMQPDCLYCSNLDLRLYEEEFHLDEVYRITGSTTPDDNSVVYALTSPTGVKGTIVNEYGIAPDNPGISKKLQDHPAT